MSSIKAQKKLLLFYKEFKNEQSQDDDEQHFTAAPDNSNIFLWHCLIIGPKDTIWENGYFKLDLTFSDDFPTAPPNAKFNPPIYHPNVYKDGRLCLDILTPKKWSPSYTMSSILLSIQSLLNDPNPDSPANHEATNAFKKYVENPENKEYVEKVRKCVEDSWQAIEE